MNTSRQTGDLGEQLTAQYLVKNNYEIIERNYITRYGEIDIIARIDDIIVFVEVKTRKNADFAQAQEAVSNSKQRKIELTALLWLQKHGVELCSRFDVVEIYINKTDKTYKVNHLIGAFDAKRR